MDASAIPINELLPHGPEMTLIDRLVSYDDHRSIASTEVTAASMFFEDTGVPAWVGLEYMAQTIAAHAGFRARLHGARPPIGLMLGTRSYVCSVEQFAKGAQLTITVAPLLMDGAFAAFDCTIATDQVVATAVVNIYRLDAAAIAGREARP